MNSDLFKIIVYMPALNEEHTISKVIASIPDSMDGFDQIEVLVVNDGSTDTTKDVAIKAGAKVISHKKNLGVGKAFQTAIDYAIKNKTDILISIDADGQFNTNQIQDFILPIASEEADFCIGDRFSNGKPQNMPKIKYWGNKRVNSIVSFISKAKIQDASCGFRAYSKECLLNLNIHGDFTYTHETILDLLNKGFVVKQIPVSVIYFNERTSRVANSIINYALKTTKIIIKSLRDYKPFYFFGTIAFLFFLVAVICGGFVMVHWIITGGITPYKSFGIFSLTMLLVSVLFLILAFLADMLGVIRKNQEKILSMNKTQYFD